MVSTSYMFNKPSDAYRGFRNAKTKEVSVLYDDKNIRDEETMYNFKADGSASSVSCAWGNKTELPPGTFSDIIAKLPKTETLNKELAQQLANMYENAYAKTQNKA